MKSRLELLKEFKEKKNTLKDSTNLQQKKDDKKTILKPKTVKNTTKEVKEKTKAIKSLLPAVPTQGAKVQLDLKQKEVKIEPIVEVNKLDLEKFESPVKSVDQNYFLIQIDSLSTQVKQLNELNARLLVEKQSLNQELSQFEEQEVQNKKQKQELEQKKKIQAKLEQMINELQSDLEKEKGLLKFNLEIGNESIENEKKELKKLVEEKELLIKDLKVDLLQVNQKYNEQLQTIVSLQSKLDQARGTDLVKSLESEVEDLFTTVAILEERGDKDFQEIKELKLRIQQLETDLLQKEVAHELNLLGQGNEQVNQENMFLVDDGTDLALWQTQVDTVNLENFEDTIILEENDENSDDTINENLLNNSVNSPNVDDEIDEGELIPAPQSQIIEELKAENEELKIALKETLNENQTVHNSLSESNKQIKVLKDENEDLKMVVELQESDEKELRLKNEQFKLALEQTLLENEALHQHHSGKIESKSTETLIENKTYRESEVQTTLDVLHLLETLDTTMKALKLQNLQRDVYKQKIDQELDDAMLKYDQVCIEKAELGKVIEEKSGLEERLLKGLEIIGDRNKALEKKLEALKQ